MSVQRPNNSFKPPGLARHRWGFVSAAAATACAANLAYALLLELVDTPIALAIVGLLVPAVALWRSVFRFTGSPVTGECIPGGVQVAAALGFFAVSLVLALVVFIAVGPVAIAFE